jgi:hypothetical protein
VCLHDGYSPAITREIARLEGQLSSVRERINTSNPARVKLQIRDTRRFVEMRLKYLGALWDGDPRIAREEIAKHVRKIELKPLLRTNVATGVGIAWSTGNRVCYGGAGGQISTVRATEFSLAVAMRK